MKHEEVKGGILAALLRLLFSAGSDFALAAAFLITWHAPYTFGEHAVRGFMYLMLIEFLVVHSTGFLGAIAAKDMAFGLRAMMYGFLLLFDGLMAGAFSVSYGGWWPFLCMTMQCLGKAQTVLMKPQDDEAQSRVMAHWAGMTALFLAGVFLTVVYDVPAYGITAEVIARQEFTVGGLWPEQPYRVIAFGAIYFTGLGLMAVAVEIIAALRRPRRRNA
jgi:hypothetical protein